MDINEKYLQVFGDYAEKKEIISAGYLDKLVKSKTRDDVQNAYDEKRIYLTELESFDNLVDSAKTINEKLEYGTIRDDFLNKIIEDNQFEIYKEKIKKKTKK